MSQGSRPDRVGDEIRAEVAQLLTRELRDPGLGFVTVTRVHVTGDLQIARIYYTVIGDERTRRRTEQALDRALPFIRRRVGSRVRLRRVPDIEFMFDKSVEQAERLERLIQEVHDTDAHREPPDFPAGAGDAQPDGAEKDDGDDSNKG